MVLFVCAALLMLPAGAAAAAPKASINDATVTEPGAGATATAPFQVSLSKKAKEKVTVNFATAPGSASATDFVGASGRVKIKRGKRTAELPITIIGDDADEPDETFTVSLSNPKHGKLGDASGVGTIVDVDAPPGGSTTPALTPGTDGDGDGVADASDNCPSTPNPDQADADGDGLGDACDVCPVDPQTTTCTPTNPNDADGDGVDNAQDNCPAVANPTQSDSDSDGHGDACDPCPNDANPGIAACPATIYMVKEGLVPNGSEVRIANAMVTAVAPGGAHAWVGVEPSDPGYQGPGFSGMEVDLSQASHPALQVGDRIDIQGTVADPFVAHSVVVDSQGGVPAAVVTTPDAFPASYDDVLAQINNVSLDAGGGTDQWTVSSGANGVDVQAGLIAHLPNYPTGTDLAAVRGIAGTGGASPVLKPRSTADIQTAAPTVGLTVDFSCVDAGNSNDPVATVKLCGPVASDTIVTVQSSDSSVATVNGGGATVPAGSDTAQVLVSTLGSGSTTLTATLGPSQATGTLTVGSPCQRTLDSLSVEHRCFASGQSNVSLATIRLNVPAPAGGTSVALSSSPSGVVTVPANVVVPAGSDSVTIVGDTASAGQATLTATLGSDSRSGQVNVGSPCPAGLVINEIDYDQVGTDTASFIEIYNPGASSVSLTNLAVVLVNGSNNSEYARYALSSAGASLGAGHYLVIANSSVTVPAGELKINVGASNDFIQNGAPDGVALIDTSTPSLIDALSYEGSITAGTITGFPSPVSLVEGTALPISTADSNTTNGSLVRSPNGHDTDNAASDWAFATTVTPGAANP
jgi:hypothetical protein